MESRFNALLLIGPTGSGKTPLGEMLEQRGLGGKRCFHFDFGASLREIAESGKVPPSLMEADRMVILDSLATGKLLENETFYIAEAILRHFMASKAMQPDDLLVLNGLPRHLGQASAIDALVQIEEIVFLECSPEVVQRRIQMNSGGDRSGRIDDSPEAVQAKLKLFEERTFPLVDHYLSQGAKRSRIGVTVHMTASEIQRELESMRRP